MKNNKSGFSYDLNEAMNYGNIFERIFHRRRLKVWISIINYKNKKILDVGCNTGILLIPLLEKGYDVAGIDNSIRDIKIAKNNLKKKNLPESRVILADAQKIPFKTNCFDVVLLSDVLEHVTNPDISAKETLRVVKKRGIIIASVPNKYHPVVKYPCIRKIFSGRNDIDQHLDIPFNKKQLIDLFPNTEVIKIGFIGFGSEILGVFRKI